MFDLPETRESLLVRVRNASDHDAWQEFVAIYRPAVYRLARKRGLQDCDAEDLAQRVMIGIARSVENWQPDPARGPFRAWIRRVTQNAIVNALTRTVPDSASGRTSVLVRLEQEPADSKASQVIDWEYRRAIFRWAAHEIRGEFQEGIWSAFWLTTVEGKTVKEAAGKLEKTSGAVYAARSRVMRRLRNKIRDHERNSSDDG